MIKDTLKAPPRQHFKDVIDDIETVRGMIEDCFDLVDTIKEWAQTQADRLETFHDVLDTLSGLPGIGSTPGLADLSNGVGDVEHTLDGINYGKDASDEKGALDSELGGLQQEAGTRTTPRRREHDGPEAFEPPGGGAYA